MTQRRIARKPASPEGRKKSFSRIASVPDREVFDKYVPRTIHGMDDFAILDYARANRINVMIEGPTGPGKTMFSRAYAAREEMPFYAVPSNVGVEPSQLFGKFIPNEAAVDDSDPKFVWVDGPVTDLVRHGGVLLINEVNFMPPRIATVMFGLLDGRREITLLDHTGEVIQAHDDLLVVADMNPDYEGTVQVNKAFRNRFGIQIEWDYDPNVEVKLVASTTLREIAEKLRKSHRDGELETPTSTNMLMEFERFAKDLSVDFAIANFVTHFTHEERASVKGVFDLNESRLADDIVVMTAPPAPPAPGSDEWSFDNATFDQSEWKFD